MNTPFYHQVVCGMCVSFCELGGESLWLAKLARSSHAVTGDGSFGSISAAITKPKSADTTIERSTAPSWTRKPTLRGSCANVTWAVIWREQRSHSTSTLIAGLRQL